MAIAWKYLSLHPYICHSTHPIFLTLIALALYRSLWACYLWGNRNWPPIYTTCILFQEKTICNKSNGNHYILQLTWNNQIGNALYFNYRLHLLGSPSSPSILSLGRRDHFEERITLDRREIVIFSTDRGSGHLCSGREGILADRGILMTILL